MDAATGLLYVGDGQYYDPATGRFLTRDAKPNNSNPYVPWNPIGTIFAPLAVLSLLYGRKRRRSKWDILVIIVLLGITTGIGIAACTPPPPNTNATAVPSPDTVPTNPAPAETPVSTGPATIPSDVPVTTPSPSTTPVVGDCATATLTPTPIGTSTPTPIDAELAQYGVSFTGIVREWTSSRIEAVRNAVRVVAERFAGIIGGSREEAFRRVYGYINFEWCDNCVNGFGWAYDDHTIKFDGMYLLEYRAIRNTIHELGHMFDRKICASRQPDGVCNGDEIFHDSARTDLGDGWNVEYCGIYLCLGRTSHSGPQPGMYWGFAGDWEEWQFGATHDVGEVWADMFLGWVYDEWGNDPFGIGTHKRDYMNSHMRSYLGGF
jgi:hypothetical protein